MNRGRGCCNGRRHHHVRSRCWCGRWWGWWRGERHTHWSGERSDCYCRGGHPRFRSNVEHREHTINFRFANEFAFWLRAVNVVRRTCEVTGDDYF
jgi:hypothetical protein